MRAFALLSLFLTALPLAQGEGKYRRGEEQWEIWSANTDPNDPRAPSCDTISLPWMEGNHEKNCTRMNFDNEIWIFKSDHFKMTPYGTWKKHENGKVTCEDPQDIDTKKCMYPSELHKIAGFEVGLASNIMGVGI